MSKEKIIKEFIEENGLRVIETTTGNNGYPENIKKAVIGFNNIEIINNLINALDENDSEWIQIKSFKIRDGWHFHKEEGYRLDDYSINDYLNIAGDNYNKVDLDCEIDFLIENLNDVKEDKESLKEIILKITELIELSESVNEDNEIIISNNGIYEIMQKRFMSFNHDVWTYNIGIYI